MRYLKESSDIALCYDGTDVPLHRYADSDVGGDVDSRRSTTDYVHFGKWSGEMGVETAKDSHLVYDRGRIYCSDRSLQGADMVEGFYERAWQEAGTPSLHNNSHSVVDLANNSVYHDKTKYIDVRYYFIRILLKDGVLSLVKIHTSRNPAHMLTKVVTTEKLKICSASLGLLG